MQDLNKQLEILGFDKQDTRIYSVLREQGPLSAGRISRLLKFPRASAYGFLKKLTEQGLVLESLRSGVKIFSSVEPEKISLLYREKIEYLQTSQEEFQKLIPFLQKSVGKKSIYPRFQLFEGDEGVRQVLKDMLLYYDLETAAFWPIKNMIETLTPDFFRYLNKERIKNRLYTRAIWPKDNAVEIKKHPYLGVGEKFLREIRIAPKNIDFPMGYWIYGNRTAFISSKKESFAFIIESKELAETLLAQFDIIWNLSKPLQDNSSEAQKFYAGLE